MLLLTTFVDGLQNFIFQLEKFFTEFQVLYAFEILFFFLMIYYVSKILRENDATKLMIIYWVLLVCGGADSVGADADFLQRRSKENALGRTPQ